MRHSTDSILNCAETWAERARNTKFVYTIAVKNITLSAEAALIERAREVARARRTTLNAEFREWLRQYSGAEERVRRYDELMKRLPKLNSGRGLTHEEMNERPSLMSHWRDSRSRAGQDHGR